MMLRRPYLQTVPVAAHASFATVHAAVAFMTAGTTRPVVAVTTRLATVHTVAVTVVCLHPAVAVTD
jgi:hypothetical protein